MWDERYGQPGYAYGTEPNDFLVEQVGALPMGEVLMLAEGEGRNAVWLAERGFRVTCIDQSAVGLAKARALAEQRGVQLQTQVADLSTHVLEPSRWTAIVSIWAHIAPDARARLHAQVVRALVPGGVLLLEAYTPEQVTLGTGGPPNPELCMTLVALRAELQGLDFIHAVERRRDVREGKYHQGSSAVVQLVARKP